MERSDHRRKEWPVRGERLAHETKELLNDYLW
jgi:hypothetical protein